MSIENLSAKYNLEIVTPFMLVIEKEAIHFDALIKGYGAANGMVVDTDGAKLNSHRDELINLGYGYNCFNLGAVDIEEDFGEVLDDWGASE